MINTYHFHFNNDADPIDLSWQQGWSVWCPRSTIHVSDIQSYYSIDQLITWANQDIAERGIQGWHTHTRYFLPQIVKINRLCHDLKRNPNRKPLLLRPGTKKWDPLTGDTRLRAYELIDPQAELETILVAQTQPNIMVGPINTRSDFARACRAESGTPFWLRLGSQGLEWYEMAVMSECRVTGQQFADDARKIIMDYVANQGASFRFDRDWFCSEHQWTR